MSPLIKISAPLQLLTCARVSRGKLLGFAVACLAVFCLFAVMPLASISGSAVLAAVTASCFCIGLLVCVARAKVHLNQAFSVAIFCWWFLITSEQFFVRKGISESSLSGNFSGAAYAECVMWVVIFFAIVAVLLKQGVTKAVLGTQIKWPLLFAFLALASCAYSPTPLFSIAWAFKLVVSVLILLACAQRMNLEVKQTAFWKSLFWAYVVLVFVPVGTTVTHPASMFGWRGFDGSQAPEFRLNTTIHPVDLSQHAALLILLGLTLHSVDRRRSRAVFVILAAAVMILAAGKAAILSCLACAVLFFLLQGRLKTGLAWFSVVLASMILALFLTPIGSYFRQYADYERAETLTGRTELWELAIPAIEQRPILGHGFVASKFVAEAVDADWDAGHLHNAFLEVMYNNGFVGLLLILIMNACIVRNVWTVLKRCEVRSLRTLAAGSLALYAFLLLNGFVEPTFGGRPSCVFLVFEGLLLLTDSLRRSVVPAASEIRAAVIPAWSPAEV